MSAGSSKVCEPTEELHYDIAVKFDGGDYVNAVMKEIVAGTFNEGDTKHVQGRRRSRAGCGHLQRRRPTQQAAMDDGLPADRRRRVRRRVRRRSTAEAFAEG